jgi:hypothetical protein
VSATNGAGPALDGDRGEALKRSPVCAPAETISKADSSQAQQASEADVKGLLLSAIKAAIHRCRLDENELLTVGLALKDDMVTAADAVAWLHDIGLVDGVIPDEVQP